MRVAMYIRVSTDEQAKDGFSISAQRERLNAFIVSQGWSIAKEYVEEGWSAKTLSRPQIQQLLADIETGNIDLVLVYRLDRLTRSVLDLYHLLQLFEQKNVLFRSATEVYDTTTAMGRLFITLVAALAQWERENLAERVKFGMEQMISEGKKPGGHSPYGYHFDKEFACTIIEHEAETVRRIFQWYADGFGYRSISQRLNELNIRPRLATTWNHNSVRDILLNDMYIGTYRWGEKRVENNHVAIIPKSLFYRVQNLLDEKSVNSPRKGKFSLTGLLRCGHCNEHPIQGFFDKRDQKNYYRCTSCNRLTDAQRIIEPLLAEIEKLLFSTDTFNIKVRNRAKEIADGSNVTLQLEKIRAQKEKWYDIFSDENNPIPKEVLFEKINQLNEREKKLQQSMINYSINKESNETNKPQLPSLLSFEAYFSLADSFHQKELLHSIFEKVVIYREKGKATELEIVYFFK